MSEFEKLAWTPTLCNPCPGIFYDLSQLHHRDGYSIAQITTLALLLANDWYITGIGCQPASGNVK